MLRYLGAFISHETDTYNTSFLLCHVTVLIIRGWKSWFSEWDQMVVHNSFNKPEENINRFQNYFIGNSVRLWIN